jgi:isopenicillin N synthase-like dioxygenase
MTKDDCLGIMPPLPALQMVNEQRDLYKLWTNACHQLCMDLFDRLDEQIGLPAGKLRSLHRINMPSTDHTRLVCTPPQPEDDRRTSLVPHTDFGSITVLFNILGGLQMIPPDADPSEEKNWQWVKPQPGCAIINLGDAMVKLTNGLFRSPVHRVTHPPGMQAPLTRHSLVYFVRPENDCILKRIEGSSMIPPLTQPEEEITAGTWVQTRAKAHQAQHPGKSEKKFASWATVGYE